MRKTLLLTLILTFICVLKSTAQQDPQLSMYLFNGLFINPAYAGSKDVIDATAIYRNQWVGIDGAPTTAHISVHSPLKNNKYNLGLSYTYDELGLVDNNNIYAQYAYRIAMNDKGMNLHLGLQAGFSLYSNKKTQALLPDQGAQPDKVFTLDDNLFLPNFGFGAYLYEQQWFIGASIPHLINLRLRDDLSNAGISDTISRQFKHWFAHAGYVFGKGEALVKVKPSILMKYVANAPIDFDFNLNFLIYDRLWLGGGYRLGGDIGGPGESMIGIIEFLATPQLKIGYAYDFILSDLSNASSGSHEIMLGYDFSFDKKRFVTPRYIKYF